MKQSTKRIVFTMLAVIFVLAACAPAQPPTVDPTEVANQVATSVALTVASQNLETAEAAPLVTETPLPTATPVVVDTPTLVGPTATPFVVVPPTTAPVSGGGSTTTKPDYACSVISRKPYDYAIFKPNDKFDIKWTIVNSGTKIMRAGLDLKYNSGEKLTSGTIELPELDPGEEYSVEFDAVAPGKNGNYIMTYLVEGGMCYPYTAITVERP